MTTITIARVFPSEMDSYPIIKDACIDGDGIHEVKSYGNPEVQSVIAKDTKIMTYDLNEMTTEELLALYNGLLFRMRVLEIDLEKLSKISAKLMERVHEIELMEIEQE